MRYIALFFISSVFYFTGCKKNSVQATSANLMGVSLDNDHFITATFAGSSYTSYAIKFNNYQYLTNSYFGLKMPTYNISQQITYFSMFMNPNYKTFFGAVGIQDGDLSIVINQLKKSLLTDKKNKN